jgi:hypothetical protein
MAMSENRTARNEAWIASLVLHVALVAGVIAMMGRPREAIVGPVVLDTRAGGHEIGLILLDRPAAVAPPRPVATHVQLVQGESPGAVLPPTPVAVVPPPPPAIRQVSHQETSPARPVEIGPPTVIGSPPSVTMPAIPPVAGVPALGSPPGSPSSTPGAADLGPPLPSGAATAFFGVPAVGKSVVFVLDRSASMGLDGRLDRARRELAASLRRLPPSARFQVIAYNRSAEPVRLPGVGGLLPATPLAVETAIAAVERLTAEGGTDHGRALTVALSLAPDVIYFLTDEDDLETRDVLAITRKNTGRVCVHALCLVAPAGDSPMQALARANRGLFKVVGR